MHACHRHDRLYKGDEKMSDCTFCSSTLARLRDEGNLRSIPADSASRLDFTDLSSNDYLGLAAKPELQEEFLADPAMRRAALSSSASRLLSAHQHEYSRLEALLSELYGRPCLLFNSGYHANTGIIPALAAGRTLILADKLVHASIIDGITLSKAEFARFRHNDLSHLQRLIDKKAAGFERVLIIAESVYSMDGDRADIEALAAIKRDCPGAMLYIDEAHAFGVEGPQGLGLCKAAATACNNIDVIVGTFGKACASSGAFCAVSSTVRDFLVNRARSFIFSTALPPLNAAWTHFIIEHMIGMDSERAHLKTLGHRLRDIINPLSPHFEVTSSHIQPLVTGSASSAISLSTKLLEEGFKVLPIRTPTVPPGTERLRISLSAALTLQQLDCFGSALTRAVSSCGINPADSGKSLS